MFSGLLTRLGNHWQARELVLVGVFATTSKLTAILIALASGGMNPLGLIAKNLVFTLLLVILLMTVLKMKKERLIKRLVLLLLVLL